MRNMNLDSILILTNKTSGQNMQDKPWGYIMLSEKLITLCNLMYCKLATWLYKSAY